MVKELNVLSKKVMMSMLSFVWSVVVEFNISSNVGNSRKAQTALYSSTLTQISRWMKFVTASVDLKQW
jgi:hypothetical protein